MVSHGLNVWLLFIENSNNKYEISIIMGGHAGGCKQSHGCAFDEAGFDVDDFAVVASVFLGVQLEDQLLHGFGVGAEAGRG
jgi:hypothetical protein